MSEMTFNEIVRVQLPKEEFNNTINNKAPNNHIKSIILNVSISITNT